SGFVCRLPKKSAGKSSDRFETNVMDCVMLPTVEAPPEKLNFEDDAYEKDLAGLIARIGNGEQTALGSLYDHTKGLVFSLAYRILRDRATAEEVSLDVFTYVWRQANKYQPDRAAPSAWLIMLTQSRAVDCLRSRSRRGLGHEPIAFDLEDASPDPEENAI